MDTAAGSERLDTQALTRSSHAVGSQSQRWLHLCKTRIFFSWSLGDFNYLVNSRTSLRRGRERGRVLKLHVDLRAALALLIHWLTLLDQNIFALEKGW